eukprot:gene21089-56274_t
MRAEAVARCEAWHAERRCSSFFAIFAPRTKGGEPEQRTAEGRGDIA